MPGRRKVYSPLGPLPGSILDDVPEESNHSPCLTMQKRRMAGVKWTEMGQMGCDLVPCLLPSS